MDLDSSPDEARALGEGALDLFCELLRALPELPVSRRWDPASFAAITPPVPDQALSRDELLAFARTLMFEYSTYCGHPRFMAYITGPGTVSGAVADFLAAGLNANVGGFRLSPGATTIETHLTRWFAESVFGLPKGAFGLLVSGGAMASFVALKAARDACAGTAIRERGLASAPPMAVYASEEAHVVIERGCDMLGLGSHAVRKIPVDRDFRMEVGALEAALAEDVARGVRPMALVATAGTVATGAIDPLPAIADLAKRHGAWLHVDGAYGALACLSPELAPLFRGIERADSIAFDPHKWMYSPHSGGCVVVRDPQRLADAFSESPAYVHTDKARTGDGVDLHMYGPQFSRGFSAFKVFFSLLAHGRAAYARRIQEDVELTRHLAAAVDRRDDMQRMSDGPLSICCFRYVPPGKALGEEQLDALNERIMTEVQIDGRAFCSNAVLGGRFVLRSCIVNHRTRRADVDALLDVVADIGGKLAASFSS